MANNESKIFAAFQIEQMLKKGTFYITDIKEAAELMGHTPGGDAYNKLRSLHCVNFGDMPDEIFNRLPSLINEALTGRRLSVAQIPCLREGNQEHIETGSEDFRDFAIPQQQSTT
jgi:hypothetical protein